MNLQNLKAYIFARATESSTWRGLILVATAVGAKLTPDQTEAIVVIGLALAGMAGAALPDSKP